MAEGLGEGVAGEGVGASESEGAEIGAASDLLSEGDGPDDAAASSEGISMLERSSPSSARIAMSLPTWTPAAPSPTCTYAMISVVLPGSRLATHHNLAHHTVVLRLDIDRRLVSLDRQQHIAGRKGCALLDLPLGNAALRHGRRLYPRERVSFLGPCRRREGAETDHGRHEEVGRCQHRRRGMNCDGRKSPRQLDWTVCTRCHYSHSARYKNADPHASSVPERRHVGFCAERSRRLGARIAALHASCAV